MPNRLVQIVSVTGLAAGATTTIAVGLANGNVALIADELEKDNPVFTIVSCTATLLTVKNESSAAASGNFKLAYYHSYQRVFGDNATQQLSPAPFVVGGSAGSSGVQDVSSLVLQFQPGGTGTGPTVFNSFADLYAELVSLRTSNGGGKYAIGYDSSLAAVTVPAGTYNLTNVDQIGLGGAQVAISYADGTVFTGARSWRNLIVTNLNTTTSPISDFVNGDQLFFDNAVMQTQTGGTIAMFRSTLTGGQAVTYWLENGSAFGGSETGRVIIVANGTNQTRIKLDALSSIAVPTAINNGGFATPVLIVTAPSMIQIPSFANWSGTGDLTPGPTLAGPMSLLPAPYLGSAQGAVISAPTFGQWLRLTSAGGNVAQVLPTINGVAANGPGTYLLVTDDSLTGTNTVSITPAGGDTIDGSSSARGVPRGGGILLTHDGVSKWSVVCAWGLNRMTLPYIWRQDNVAANQAAVAISPTGTLFSTFMATRAGSVVGLLARFNANVTVDGATVTVTINGVATALTTTVNNGSSSGSATQFAGVSNYAAGDLIGVTITTTAGFTPTTVDFEAYVEVEECP